MSNKNGLVLATCLPFHKGHEFLINFASSYCGNGQLLVIMSSRSKEPISGVSRFNAIRETFRGTNVVVVHHFDDLAPQNPKGENDTEFWEYWKTIIENSSQFLENPKIDYVFSSEEYGDKVADVIGAKHIIVDQTRETINISGTAIRKYPILNQDMINSNMMKYLRKKVVFFGAESVGKTTMTRIMGKRHKNSMTTPEYARPYLIRQEDKTPSFYNMDNIFHGQHALEQSLIKTNGGGLYAFMDTDIMSTFGYAKMVGMDVEPYKSYLPSDDRIYILLAQQDVPFEKDVLRYGDGVRESTDQYWIDILAEYGISCHVVGGTIHERIDKVDSIILNEVRKTFSFDRE